MNSLDLSLLDKAISEFIAERDWDQFHSIKNLSMALSVEVAELVEIFQWMTEAASNSAPTDPALRPRIEDEIADIFVYLLRIVTRADIDLEQAVLRKIEKNAQKYPVDRSRGSAKKYTDLDAI